jgi:molybdenum-dependent DNA-binding transcriptional regulator ModE
MELKHKIWLEEDARAVFGPGRKELLKMVDECQSLNAARRMKRPFETARHALA